MDEDQNDLTSLDQYFQDLTAVEQDSPLMALARDPREKLLIQQAEAAEARRKKAFEEELAAMEAAKQRLLQLPTKQSRAQMLAGLTKKFREGRSDPNDPRFYEKRNVMTLLRDLSGARRERLGEEKKLEEAKKEQLLKFEDMRRKYILKEAEREAEAARGALEKYRPDQDARTSEFERLIADLPEADQKKLRRDRAEMLSRRGPGSVTQFDRTVSALVRKRKGIATEEDEAILELGRKGGLTVSQQRTDADILNAREFIKGFDKRKIDMAFRNPYRSSVEDDIVNAYKLARKKTYQEMMASGEVSAPIPEEGGAEVIEEEMP